MKKCLSLILSIITLLSVFSVCGVLVSAANAGDLLTVKATEVVNGKVTYNIYLNANTPVSGAVVKVKYDNTVLSPAKETFDNAGAFTVTDEDGNNTPVVSGEYVGGLVNGTNNCFSVGFVRINDYKSSSQKGFMSISFDVIDDERPVTSVEFYCVEFRSQDSDIDIPKNEANPQRFATVKTTTIEKTVFSKVESVLDGLKITWKPTAGAAYYNFYKAKPTGGWEVVKLPATQTSYIDTNVVNGEEATYAVKAYNKNNESASTYNKISGKFVQTTSKLSSAVVADGVKVSWSAVKNVDYYRVYKRVVNEDGTRGAWTTAVSKTTSTSFKDTKVTSNVKYEYGVRTFKGSLYSAVSKVSAIRYYAAPAVKMTAVSGGVKVTWNEIDGAQSYKIYRKYDGAKSWTVIGTVDADTLSFVDKAPKSCYKISYTVRAFAAENGSSSYVEKSFVYVAIPKLTSIANTRTGVQVKWSADSRASGYRVYRKAAGAKSWTYITTVKTAYYNDKNVKSGTNYTYTVRTVYGKNTSGFESGISIKYLATPTLAKVSNVSAGIQFKWNAVSGATGYIVYRKTGSGSWQRVGTVKTNQFVDKNVKNGTTYTYTVKAYNGSTTSGYNTTGLKIKCS